MEVDHIFIFSRNNGEEADDLVDFGLMEGSSRVHPGQGTRNRKFYFGNFFLEVLWVEKESEIRSDLTAPTKLWERSQFEKNGCSPYGLCLVNSTSTDRLFKRSKIYQPDYFPEGMSIDIITNEQHPNLPWTFRLPYRGEKKASNEPIEHPNGMKKLTLVELEAPVNNEEKEFKNYFHSSKTIEFKDGNRTYLTLEFDKESQGKSKEFPELNLTINY